MMIQTEQKTTEHREANGLHDDMVSLKVDVATIKEQCNHFATKADVAKAKNELLNAFNRFALRVIVVLVSMMVALLGMIATALF